VVTSPGDSPCSAVARCYDTPSGATMVPAEVTVCHLALEHGTRGNALMDSHRLKDRCPGCAQSITVFVRQRFGNERWTWTESIDCPHCGYVQLVDGCGLPSPDLRAQLLAEGLWALVLDGSSVALLAFVKRLLGLSPIRLLEVKRRLPGVLVVGTSAEMALLAARFEGQSYRTCVERAASPDLAFDLADLVDPETGGPPAT
jgi:hypothetical protein